MMYHRSFSLLRIPSFFAPVTLFLRIQHLTVAAGVPLLCRKRV
jgi:hypothetical protein